MVKYLGRSLESHKSQQILTTFIQARLTSYILFKKRMLKTVTVCFIT